MPRQEFSEVRVEEPESSSVSSQSRSMFSRCLRQSRSCSGAAKIVMALLALVGIAAIVVTQLQVSTSIFLKCSMTVAQIIAGRHRGRCQGAQGDR